MPDTLARALRDVVDTSADPVTVDEVLGLPQALPRSRRRWPLMLAAAAIVLAAGVAGVLVSRDTTAPDLVTATTPPPATTIDTPPLRSCAVPMLAGEPGEPCSVTEEQATVMLGFPVREPAGIPEDWTLVYSYVALYRGEDWGSAEDIVQSRRTWYRDPQQQEVPCTTQLPPVCPGDQVQVTVRQVIEPGDSRDVRRIGPSVFDLDDGTEVHGNFFRDTAFLMWVADGRYYRLRTFGLPRATVRTIADSLA